MKHMIAAVLTTVSLSAAALAATALLLVQSAAGAQTNPPFVAYGSFLRPGDVVDISANGTTCATVTADPDGNWVAQIGPSSACEPSDGDTLSFTLNGYQTTARETWAAGGAPANTAVGTVLVVLEFLAPVTDVTAVADGEARLVYEVASSAPRVAFVSTVGRFTANDSDSIVAADGSFGDDDGIENGRVSVALVSATPGNPTVTAGIGIAGLGGTATRSNENGTFVEPSVSITIQPKSVMLEPDSTGRRVEVEVRDGEGAPVSGAVVLTPPEEASAPVAELNFGPDGESSPCSRGTDSDGICRLTVVPLLPGQDRHVLISGTASAELEVLVGSYAPHSVELRLPDEPVVPGQKFQLTIVVHDARNVAVSDGVQVNLTSGVGHDPGTGVMRDGIAVFELTADRSADDHRLDVEVVCDQQHGGCLTRQTASATGVADVQQRTPAQDPAVIDLAPEGGPPEGGGTVSITGTGLDGVVSVDFGGLEASIGSQGDAEISVQVPTGDRGEVEVSLSTESGVAISAGTYRYRTMLDFFSHPIAIAATAGAALGAAGLTAQIRLILNEGAHWVIKLLVNLKLIRERDDRGKQRLRPEWSMSATLTTVGSISLSVGAFVVAIREGVALTFPAWEIVVKAIVPAAALGILVRPLGRGLRRIVGGPSS